MWPGGCVPTAHVVCLTTPPETQTEGGGRGHWERSDQGHEAPGGAAILIYARVPPCGDLGRNTGKPWVNWTVLAGKDNKTQRMSGEHTQPIEQGNHSW